jgi:hypothetical protein
VTRIVKYKIANAPNVTDLTRYVNNLIESNDWQPLGGAYRDDGLFFQTLVIYETFQDRCNHTFIGNTCRWCQKTCEHIWECIWHEEREQATSDCPKCGININAWSPQWPNESDDK